MNLEYFSAMPFIQSISDNARWTVSTKTKMPIDMNRLIKTGEIVGAKFDNGNNPLVTLPQLISGLPNAANAAYKLNQSVDEFVVLDIEPKCPANIRDKLLTLPYKYCELSMSGSGFHLVFDKPNTQYQDILYGKPAVKEKHGWYEILLNHYVTFTGKVCLPSEDCIFVDVSDFEKLFDELASQTKIQHTFDINTDDLPKLEDIPLHENIVDLISKANYNKTLKDFDDDNSKYEFGIVGFYHKKLNMLLDTTKYRTHDYTPQERIVLLHEIIADIIPYRTKHDSVRDGLPWLMYTCKRVVSSKK